MGDKSEPQERPLITSYPSFKAKSIRGLITYYRSQDIQKKFYNILHKYLTFTFSLCDFCYLDAVDSYTLNFFSITAHGIGGISKV